MAGYVKLLRSIWTDPDFVALDTEAQRLYLLLISQPDISHVGVVPFMPARWARLSVTSTVDATLDATLVLEAHNFVAVDNETGELWVRSYIIHDEAWKLTNGKKSLVNAHERVYSPRLRNLIATVLATVDVTVTSTLEPTVDVSHKPATIRHEPAPAPKGGAGHPKQVALDVAARLMEHESNIARPNAWKLTVAERLMRDYDVPALIDQHGTHGAADHLFALERPNEVQALNPYAPRPMDHDPNCDQCAGSGYRTIEEGGLDCEPCDCKPALADVVELRSAQ